MNILSSNQIKTEISTDVKEDKPFYNHAITIKIKNEYTLDVHDTTIYLFVYEKYIPTYSKCVQKFSLLASAEEKSFIVNYTSEVKDPLFNFRVVFRVSGEITHQFFNVTYPSEITSTITLPETLAALLNIKGLCEIINVIPITNGISFTNFGAILDTLIKIYYRNNNDEFKEYKICKTTLLKGYDISSIDSITYGSYSSFSLGNSVFLEIPIIIN